MGYDQPDRSSSSGAVVAVLLAIVAVVVLGGLVLVGVGSLFYVRTAQVQRQAVVEVRRAEAAKARAVAEAASERLHADAIADIQRRSAEKTEVLPARDSQSEFELILSRNGTVSVDDREIDVDELRASLERRKSEAGGPLRVRVEVDPQCPREHVVSLLDACRDVVSEVTLRMTPADDAPGTTEAAEPSE